MTTACFVDEVLDVIYADDPKQSCAVVHTDQYGKNYFSFLENHNNRYNCYKYEITNDESILSRFNFIDINDLSLFSECSENELEFLSESPDFTHKVILLEIIRAYIIDKNMFSKIEKMKVSQQYVSQLLINS